MVSSAGCFIWYLPQLLSSFQVTFFSFYVMSLLTFSWRIWAVSHPKFSLFLIMDTYLFVDWLSDSKNQIWRITVMMKAYANLWFALNETAINTTIAFFRHLSLGLEWLFADKRQNLLLCNTFKFTWFNYFRIIERSCNLACMRVCLILVHRIFGWFTHWILKNVKGAEYNFLMRFDLRLVILLIFDEYALIHSVRILPSILLSHS
jgi:hypothetical protein